MKKLILIITILHIIILKLYLITFYTFHYLHRLGKDDPVTD
jgi:hypothetical protein